MDLECPERARRLILKNVVRVQVTVAAGGPVKEMKELGCGSESPASAIPWFAWTQSNAGNGCLLLGGNLLTREHL